eukprot:2127489-Karenia_brevis.AAC.1
MHEKIGTLQVEIHTYSAKMSAPEFAEYVPAASKRKFEAAETDIESVAAQVEKLMEDKKTETPFNDMFKA